jgi:hypothetical protein
MGWVFFPIGTTMVPYEPESPKHYTPKHMGRMRGVACKHCGSVDSFSIGKFIGPAGQIKHPYYCTRCHKRTTIYEPSHDHLIYTAVFDTSEINECEVCGKEGAEWHHWAPRDLFGDLCERWPQGLLCQYCHSQWHQIVTPGEGFGPCSG